jgi:hypothetical protein
MCSQWILCMMKEYWYTLKLKNSCKTYKWINKKLIFPLKLNLFSSSIFEKCQKLAIQIISWRYFWASGKWHFFFSATWNYFLYVHIFKFFCVGGTGAWPQGLHLEPLHRPFFVMGIFEIGSHGSICLGWLQTAILLISSSWVARITGVSHQGPTMYFNFW